MEVEMKRLFAIFTVLAAVLFISSSSYACEGGCNKECKGGCAQAQLQADKEGQPAVPKDMIGKEATCPVSGEKFKVTEKTPFSTYKGTNYYFCCPGCKPKFDAEPEKFIKK